MSKTKPVLGIVASALLLAMAAQQAHAGIPLYTLTPINPLTTNLVIPSNGNAVVQFLLKSNKSVPVTLFARNFPGVTVSNAIINTSNALFSNCIVGPDGGITLPAQGACIINYDVALAAPLASVSQAPAVCNFPNNQPGNPSGQCYTSQSLINARFVGPDTRKVVGVGSVFIQDPILGRIQVPISNTSNSDGFVWNTFVLPQTEPGRPNAVLAAVSCGQTGVCAAVGTNESGVGLIDGVGQTYFSTDFGNTWTLSITQPPLPPTQTLSQLFTVSCNNATGLICVACGDTGAAPFGPTAFSNYCVHSTDGGQNWALSTLPPTPGPSFPSINAVFVSKDGSSAIIDGAALNAGFTDVVIYSARSTDGGATFASPYTVLDTSNLPAGLVFIPSTNNMACDDTAEMCFFDGSTTPIGAITGEVVNAVSTAALAVTTTNGGASWTLPIMLPSLPGITDPTASGGACDSTGTKCIATGRFTLNGLRVPVVWLSATGGNTWLPPTILSLPSSLASGGLPVSGTAAPISIDGLALNGVVGGNVRIGDNLFPISWTTNNGGLNWSLPVFLPVPANDVSVFESPALSSNPGLQSIAGQR